MGAASRYGSTPSPASLANLRPWTWEDQERGRQSQFVPAEVGTRPRYKIALIRYIRQKTHNGREMADLMLQVLRGQRLAKVGDRRNVQPTVEQRMSAAIWLTDRAFGKAKEFLELTDGEPSGVTRRANLAALTDEERATLRALLVKSMLAAEGAEVETDGEPRDRPAD